MRIFVNSIPKSGTHLATKVLDLAGMTRDINVQIDYGAIRNPDTDTLRTLYQPLLSLTPQTYGAGHALWDQFSADYFATNNIRMILVMRDPRDVALSAADWFIDERSGYKQKAMFKTLSLRQRLDYVFTGRLPDDTTARQPPLLDIYKNMARWRDYPNILVTTFERLVGERGGSSTVEQRQETEAICRYVGRADSDIDSIAAKLWGDSQTFRHGVAGGWREHQNYFPGGAESFTPFTRSN